jgi:predicted RNA-binding protein YlxR (DUF448 family)
VADVDDLVRVVRTAGGGLAVGRSLPGRGAWLCARSPSCIDLAGRRRAFARAFRAPVDPTAVSDLRRRLATPSRRSQP